VILHICHYLIVVFTYEYDHDYALNIADIHSILCLSHSSTKHRIERLHSASTLQPNRKQNDSVLPTKHRTNLFHYQNLEQNCSALTAPEPNITLLEAV
jgi:hypothetical protein